MVSLKTNQEKLVFSENPQVEMMDLLVEKTRALGRIVTFSDATNDPDFFKPNQYAFYYGSFEKAALEAWRRVTKHA